MSAPETVRFIFGIHNHQPVGNFPEIFEKATDRAYDPLLAAFTRHPDVRAAIHYSGCLLEWMEANRPKHLDGLRLLASRGQIEFLSGGFYEPILPQIPAADRVGQIRLLTRYIKDAFGVEARGMWLAERVWEPSLPSDMARAGIDYTLLDDYHFLSALDEDPVGGYYVTEDSGNPIALFPISEALRYLIPFKEPEETIRFLFERRGLGEVVVMMDDGEKYGLWPDTYEWVHEGGWLERFFTALERAQGEGWLKTTTFAEASSELRPRGRVYLPPNSYFEMTEWALPPGRRLRFEETARRLREKGEWAPMRPFMKGGFFRSYLARYSEARRSVARGRALSTRLDPIDGSAAREGRPSAARRHLWRAQCNCAYWHGLFGGLYLPHLRRGIQDSLALGTAALWDVSPEASGVRARISRVDDLDEAEIEVDTEKMSLLIHPSAGGALSVCDFTRRPLPLGCTLTRRYEAYHDEALRASRAASGAAPAAEADAVSGGINIHERTPSVPRDLPRHLIADTAERLSLVERFLPKGTTPAELMAVEVADLAMCDARATAAIRRDGGAAVVGLSRRIRLRNPEAEATEFGFELLKEIRCRSGREGFTAAFRAARSAEPGDAPGILFAVELNLAFVESATRAVGVGPGDPRTVSEAWSSEEVSRCRFVETHRRFQIVFRLSPQGSLWHHPVRTISRCEAGFELIYQGSAVIFVWPLSALAGEGITLDLDVEDHGSAAAIVR